MICHARRNGDGFFCKACKLSWDEKDEKPPCGEPEKALNTMPVTLQEPTEHHYIRKRRHSREWKPNDFEREKAKGAITPDMWQGLRDKINGKTDGKRT